MQTTSSQNLYRFDTTLFSRTFRIALAILFFSAIFEEEAFAQITDIFKAIDGVALWGSLGGLHHTEINSRQFILPGGSLRYGAELFIGPYPDSPKTVSPQYEFGLGANFADGYRTNISGFDVRMPIRTIYLAAYLEFQKPISFLAFSPYIGSTVGINTDLKGTSLDATASTDSTNVFELTANTIPIEILVGGWWQIAKGFNIFTEVSYEYLAFDGLVYKALGTSALPARRPHRIDLSGWYLTLGFQFARKPKDN